MAEWRAHIKIAKSGAHNQYALSPTAQVLMWLRFSNETPMYVLEICRFNFQHTFLQLQTLRLIKSYKKPHIFPKTCTNCFYIILDPF